MSSDLSGRCTLSLTAKGARYLTNSAVFGSNLLMKVWTTSTRDSKHVTNKYAGKNTAVWNDTFDIKIDEYEKEFLFMEVISTTITGQHIIGRIKLPCHEIKDELIEKWISIYGEDGKTAGEVNIAFRIRSQAPSIATTKTIAIGSSLSPPQTVFQIPSVAAAQAVPTTSQPQTLFGGFSLPSSSSAPAASYQQPAQSVQPAQPVQSMQSAAVMSQPQVAFGGFALPSWSSAPQQSVYQSEGYATAVVPTAQAVRPGIVQANYAPTGAFAGQTVMATYSGYQQPSAAAYIAPSSASTNVIYPTQPQPMGVAAAYSSAYAPASSTSVAYSSTGVPYIAAAAPALPEFWEERTAPDGRKYYVDHRTQTTQWNHPGTR